MIDKNLIGHEFEAVTLPVEEGRLRFVAKSIGETNPVTLIQRQPKGGASCVTSSTDFLHAGSLRGPSDLSQGCKPDTASRRTGFVYQFGYAEIDHR